MSKKKPKAKRPQPEGRRPSEWSAEEKVRVGDLPKEVRRILYSTNAIESLNYQLRKIIKSKGHFPSDESRLQAALSRPTQR